MEISRRYFLKTALLAVGTVLFPVFSSLIAKKDFEKAEEHYNSGLKEYSSGYISKAIEEWESCLKYNPNHERAKNALAKARKTLKK